MLTIEKQKEYSLAPVPSAGLVPAFYGELQGPDSGIYTSLRQAGLLEVEGIRRKTKREIQ